MIKCIVCDLDGTLIKSDDTIEKKTYQTLQECMKNNVEFIIATGRDINMVKDFIERYHLDCDLILNNGTQYCNPQQTMNEIYPMDNDSFLKISHILMTMVTYKLFTQIKENTLCTMKKASGIII